MKQYKQQTSWPTLLFLTLGSILLGLYLITVVVDYKIQTLELEIAIMQSDIAQNQPVRREVRIITTSEYNEQKYRQSVLQDLMHCESGGKKTAIGDNGNSQGYYQWQKPTFDEKVGFVTTYKYYLEYVQDYEKITTLTEKVFFDQGEWRRWTNCSFIIGYKK